MVTSNFDLTERLADARFGPQRPRNFARQAEGARLFPGLLLAMNPGARPIAPTPRLLRLAINKSSPTDQAVTKYGLASSG